MAIRFTTQGIPISSHFSIRFKMTTIHKNVVLPTLPIPLKPTASNNSLFNVKNTFSKLTKYVNSYFHHQDYHIPSWTLSHYKKIVVIGIHGELFN